MKNKKPLLKDYLHFGSGRINWERDIKKWNKKVKMIYNHNQIQTRTKEVVIGKDYAYFEEFPNAIAMVKVLEDNSNDEFIKFKLEISRTIHPSMVEGKIFECSAKRGLYSYAGMWMIKDPSIENLMPAMHKPSKVQTPMDMDYIKSVCKMGAGGGQCCRYLTMGSAGFECANLEPEMKELLDQRADSGQMNAIGKNCNGYGKEVAIRGKIES